MKKNDNLTKEGNQRTPLADLWNEAVEYDRTKAEIGDIIGDEIRKERIRNRWTVYSAAASVLVLVGLFVIFRPFSSGSRDDSGASFAQTDSTALEDEGELLIIDQPESREYARLGTASESTANLLKAPADSSVFNPAGQIQFQWQAPTVASVLIIQLHPGNSVVFRHPIKTGDSTFVIEPGKLGEGSYRWSVYPDTTSRMFIVRK